MNGTLSLALALGLVAAGRAAAAGGSVTDQAVTLTYGAGHWSTLPAADLVGVDATGDQVYQAGWWYRIEGDTREYPLPLPDSETYLAGKINVIWNDVDLKGFKFQETTVLFDGEGPSGGFHSEMTVINNNATSKQITLFHYLDPDLAATSGNDSGALVHSRFLTFSDGASRLSYRGGPFATHYKVGAWPSVRDLLNDSAVTTLDDTGLPFGPGTATAAIQFGPVAIGAGGAYTLGNLTAFFNAPQAHVKGDLYGLGLANLWGQRADLGSRGFFRMRRTELLGSAGFSGPTSTSSLVGVDDFYAADFEDEPVFRDTVTGVAYVGWVAISGAPTLPPNWKLSATGDFDADGHADILWRNTTSQKLVIWTMNGNAKVGAIIPNPDQAVDGNWEVAAAADFNGDGNRDLLWYNQTSGKIVLWLMNASVVRTTGQFTNPPGVGNNNWRALAVGDYGKGPGGVYDTQDVVWQNDTSKKIVVWFMDLAGNRTGGTFTTPDTLIGSWDVVGPR